MHKAEKAAEQTLPRKKLADKIADMAAINIPGLQINRRQALAHDLRKRPGKIHALPRPIGRKIALPAAENIDHGPPTLI